MVSLFVASPEVKAEGFDSAVEKLTSKKRKVVASGIEALVASKDDRADFYLEALLDSKLYRHKKENTLLYLVEKNDEGLKTYQVANPDVTETFSKTQN